MYHDSLILDSLGSIEQAINSAAEERERDQERRERWKEERRRKQALEEAHKRKARIEREKLKLEALSKKAPEPEPDWEALAMEKMKQCQNKIEEPKTYWIRRA